MSRCLFHDNPIDMVKKRSDIVQSIFTPFRRLFEWLDTGCEKAGRYARSVVREDNHLRWKCTFRSLIAVTVGSFEY